VQIAGDETSTEANSIVFKLNVRCKREGNMIVNEKGEPLSPEQLLRRDVHSDAQARAEHRH
jgi:hypothetical protein